jgi:AraC-like DNA-binding protein
MSEVSLAVGFADQSVFTRAFTRWYGQTPHAYRLNDAFGPS